MRLTFASYNIHKAVGLDRSVIERHFSGTASRIAGVGLHELAREHLGAQ